MAVLPAADAVVRRQLETLLQSIEADFKADAITYVGPIAYGADDQIKEAVEGVRHRKRQLVFILETFGGYAEVARKERSKFNAAVADYLEKRKNVYCAFVLIDSRLPPQRIDLEFVRWLGSCPVPFALVFTKTDKQSAAKTEANIATFRQSLATGIGAPAQIFTSSAKTKRGRMEILGFIEQTLAKNLRA